MGPLAQTIRYAVLDELTSGLELDNKVGAELGPHTFFGIQHDVVKMLDWLIRHDPRRAAATISEIVGEAERRLKIPRVIIENSFHTALALDAESDANQRRKFLERVLSPQVTPATTEG